MLRVVLESVFGFYITKERCEYTMFIVVDRKTGDKVGSYQSVKRARNKRDKLDNEYGGYRYVIKDLQTLMNVY